MTEKRRWWDPARHGARRDKLMARNALKGELRSFFTDRGFIEVDVGCVAVSPGNETHLTAFQTEFVPALGHSQRPQKLFLHTSPEFACKKLMAAGERALFTFAPTFRNGEVSPRHSPEFTMLEWYQAGATFEDLLQQMAELIETVAMAGTDTVTIHDRTIPLDNGVDRITVCDAFVTYSDVDLAAHLRDAPFDCGDLAERANTANIRTSDDDDWSDVFSKIMTGIEPMLGLEKPVLLTHYPAPEAALARLSDADPNVAERVEFYIGGVEI
ncbi:MAG: amino acid--tRNA ligase-related protein, partial [Pseudomonadota bacterium]